jgi:hypothetical protein
MCGNRVWKQGQVGPGVGLLEKELVGRGKGRGGRVRRGRKRERIRAQEWILLTSWSPPHISGP